MECINIGEPAGPTSSLPLSLSLPSSPASDLGSRQPHHRQTRPDTSRGTGYSYKPLLHCNNRRWILDPNALISKRRRRKEGVEGKGERRERRAAHALAIRGLRGPPTLSLLPNFNNYKISFQSIFFNQRSFRILYHLIHFLYLLIFNFLLHLGDPDNFKIANKYSKYSY